MAKKIVVYLGRQVLQAFDGAAKVHEFHCTTGSEGHETEVGRFRIFRKHRLYTSKKYNAPMNYAMFFSADGKAIHEGYMVTVTSFLKAAGIDSIGSHGCVRLGSANARTMFDWAPMGTVVEIKA